jgi:ABC-type nitrate/sulfonate/bicarbonate transport system substrate-binding protein
MKERRAVTTTCRAALFTFLFSLAPGVGLGATPATVRVGFFSTSLPLTVAQAKGYFLEEGIAVSTFQVRSSVQMFQRVRDDLMDVAFSSPDNPVNYRLNPHNAVGVVLDVTMLLGTDYGLGLALFARPGFPSAASLRGARIGVDAPDSGYAYVLYAILAMSGLQRGIDYQVVVIGGTPIRLAALRAGTIDATLLNSDSAVRAAAEGMIPLGSVAEIGSPYLGGVASAPRSWLQANPAVAVGFIRAYFRAQRWVMDPANRDEAIQLLVRPGTTTQIAEQIYDQLLGATGLVPDARFDRKGLLAVLRLRDRFGGFEQEQNLAYLDTPASGLFDLSYYRRATNDATADDVVGPESNPLYVKDWAEIHDPLAGHASHGHDTDGEFE